MAPELKRQSKGHLVFYILFAVISTFILMYYLSFTIIHPTSDQQFPVNSFVKFPLSILIFPAEIFAFAFALYFVYNLVSDRKEDEKPLPLKNKKDVSVAILLPVYNEPKEIVERTAQACRNIRWDGEVNIYLLDDSNDEVHRKDMDEVAEDYDLRVIRRSDRNGYKAGNINNAIKKKIYEDYFVIFDADQAPEKDFLEETMDYFSDETIAFVQTPQYFVNDDTPLGRSAKLGTEIFYFAQCKGKARDGALPFCGTNVVVRTSVFRKARGFSYYTSTEDIDLGIKMNSLGYRGAYVPKVLTYGYSPPDFKSYSSQQYRWANGNMAILRESWLKILGGNFPLKYQVHMFFTLGWWLIGVVSLIFIVVPIASLMFGLGTHHTWLPTYVLGALFVNVGLGIGMIYASLGNRVNGEKVTMADAFYQFSLITNSMFIYTRAAVNALLFKKYIGFVTTNKKGSSTGLAQIKWNLLLGAVCFGFSVYALYFAAISGSFQQLRTYLPISIWLLFYAVILGSSVMFVGKTSEAGRARDKVGSRTIQSQKEREHNAIVITGRAREEKRELVPIIARRRS